MKIPVPNGGSSGSGSTECTATAEDILETKTAIYNGSGDEPDYGSMKNVDSIDPAKSITISSGVLYVRFTNGAHVQNASSGYPEVSVPQADLASAAGLTAAKIATGNSILGIAGTYTGVGTAGTSQVLSGYTFSNASLSGASGAMSDRSGTTTSATASLDSSNSRVRMQIPNTGYYNTSAYLYTSYSSIASLIGLTAAKIKKGESILGITGTWEGYVADTNDLYNRGSVGTLGGTLRTYSDGITVTADTNCVRVDVYSGVNDSQYGAAVFSNQINFYNYNSITLEFEVITPYGNAGVSNLRCFGIGLFSSLPSSAAACAPTNAQYNAQSTEINSAGTKTVTLDTSNITGQFYVAVFIENNAMNVVWDGEILRVSVN